MGAQDRAGTVTSEGLPSGTLTFVFSDIEASTERWELRPDAMREALALHDDLLAEHISAAGGQIFKHTGDGVGAVFTSASAAVRGAIAAQKALQRADWPENDRLKVRMGIHAGDGSPAGGDYVGATVNRAARLGDVANGDQIAVSPPIAALVSDVELIPQGEHQLRGIGSDEVWLVHADDLVEDLRPLRSRVLRKGHAPPAQPGETIGREREIQEISALLRDQRLVTITGPGGVGKTRLAADVARVVSERFDHVPAYCELAQVTDADAVVEVIAEAIGARRQPGMDMAESIVNFLGGRSVLLVLDNCEHLVPSVRAIMAEVLSVPGPAILATSRSPVGGAQTEQIFPLEPLDAATHGLELFVMRARERDPHFEVSDKNRHDLQQICQRLDGIPAAIELAAARVRVLSPAQLLTRLDDRFRVLRSRDRGDSERTLLDTVIWSYDQLEPSEAALFEQLSVFSGSFSLDAAEVVAGDASGAEVIDLLMGLVDKSMLASERGVGQVRFQLLETMRAFGAQRLTERGLADTIRGRHADYFAEFAANQADQLMTADEADVWRELGQDWPNLRSAFDSLRADQQDDQAVELVLGLAWFATFSMRFEALAWARSLADEPRIQAHQRYPALLGACALAAYFVTDPEAAALARSALDVDVREPFGLARGALGAIYLNNLHSLADSDRTTSEWLDSLDDPESTTENELWALAMRTFHLALNNEPDVAQVADRVLHLGDRLGSASAIGMGRWAQGLALASQLKLDEASRAWEQGLDAVQSLSSQHLVAHMLNGLLAHFKSQFDDLPTVLPFCRDLLRQAIEQHYLAGASHLFGVTAIVLTRAGDAQTGAALLGAMQANGHVPRPPALSTVRSELGNGFDKAAAIGEHWLVKQAGVVALDALEAAITAHPDPGKPGPT